MLPFVSPLIPAAPLATHTLPPQSPASPPPAPPRTPSHPARAPHDGGAPRRREVGRGRGSRPLHVLLQIPHHPRRQPRHLFPPLGIPPRIPRLPEQRIAPIVHRAQVVGEVAGEAFEAGDVFVDVDEVVFEEADRA